MPRAKPKPEKTIFDQVEDTAAMKAQAEAQDVVRRRAAASFRSILEREKSMQGNRSVVPVTLSPASCMILQEIVSMTGLARGRVFDELLNAIAEDLSGLKREREAKRRALWGDEPEIGSEEFTDALMQKARKEA